MNNKEFKDLEKIHNKYCTDLRQEINRFKAEIKERLNGLDDRIRTITKEELAVHIPIIHDSIKFLGEKVKHHFGS